MTEASANRQGPGPLFQSRFRARIVDLPFNGCDYTFKSKGAGARAISLLVEPDDGSSWLATFAADDPLANEALSGIWRTPSPTGLCVIERGTAFLGDVLTPSEFAVIETCGPIVAMKELIEQRLLLLISPWTITAVSAEGVRWVTDRIAIEGISVKGVDSGQLIGVSDPGGDESHGFVVDISTGKLIGGGGVTW